MKPFKLAFALGAALLAAACLPVTSKTPVGTTVGLGADPALIGTWKVIPDKRPDKRKDNAQDGNEPGFIHFILAKDGTITALTVSSGTAGDAAKSHGEWSVFAATTAQLGQNHILNVHETSENGEASKEEDANNIPILYRFGRGGKLTLYLIDEKQAKAAIAAGKIEGTVEAGDYGDVTLTAPADKLDAFFASEDGAALFKEELIALKRVK